MRNPSTNESKSKKYLIITKNNLSLLTHTPGLYTVDIAFQFFILKKIKLKWRERIEPGSCAWKDMLFIIKFVTLSKVFAQLDNKVKYYINFKLFNKNDEKIII